MINLISHKDHVAGPCKTDVEFSISHGDGRASLHTQIENAEDLEKIGQDFLEAAKIRRAMETI